MPVAPSHPNVNPGPLVANNPAIAYVPTLVSVASYQAPDYDYDGYKSNTTPINCVSHSNPIPVRFVVDGKDLESSAGIHQYLVSHFGISSAYLRSLCLCPRGGKGWEIEHTLRAISACTTLGIF